MNVTELILVWTQATVVTILACDFFHRRMLNAKMDDNQAQMKDAAEKLAELHNSSVKQIQSLTDRMNGIELMQTKGPTVRRL
jgi:hypothetical protein